MHLYIINTLAFSIQILINNTFRTEKIVIENCNLHCQDKNWIENKAIFSNAKISVSNVHRNSDLTAGFSRACRISRPFATVKVSTNNRSYVLLRFYETFFVRILLKTIPKVYYMD